MSIPYPEMKKELSPLRKKQKIVVEKKRRNRINSCLEELKALLLESMSKQNPQVSKLEKGDILELAVRYLRQIHTHQLQNMISNPKHMIEYTEGFSECANEVQRYISNLPGVDASMRLRLMEYLSTRSSMTLAARARQVASPESRVSSESRRLGSYPAEPIPLRTGSLSVDVIPKMEPNLPREYGLCYDPMLMSSHSEPGSLMAMDRPCLSNLDSLRSVSHQPLAAMMDRENIQSLQDKFSSIHRGFESFNCGVQAVRAYGRPLVLSQNDSSVWRPW